MIEKCLDHMEEFIRGSTRYNFEQSNFYQELPATLKQKLVKSVLFR